MQAARCIDDFDAQSLCNLLYGLAVLQQPLGTELAAALPLAIAHRCASICGCIAIPPHVYSVYRSVEHELLALCRVYEFTPQGLAVSVWALSGLQASGHDSCEPSILDCSHEPDAVSLRMSSRLAVKLAVAEAAGMSVCESAENKFRDLQAAGECDVTAQLLDLVAERAVALAADFGPLDTCNLLVGHCSCWMTICVCCLLPGAYCLLPVAESLCMCLYRGTGLVNLCWVC